MKFKSLVVTALFFLIPLTTGCSHIYEFIGAKAGGRFAGQPSEMPVDDPELEAMLTSAFTGLDAVIDHHVHVIGYKNYKVDICQNMGYEVDGVDGILSTEKNGIYINSKRFNGLNPILRVKTETLIHASAIHKVKGADDELQTANSDYANRLLRLARHFKEVSRKYGGPQKIKFLLLAFDKVYLRDKDGNSYYDYSKTDIYIPNDYVYNLAACLNRQDGIDEDTFVPVISLHPLNPNATQNTLDMWSARGVRHIKWLPNTMIIDPKSQESLAFLKKAAKANMYVIAHTGHEEATAAESENQHYGHPNEWKKALSETDVNLIMSHAGHEGKLVIRKKETTNFDLFLKMMGEEKFKDHLLGDISAVTVIKNADQLKNRLSVLIEDKDGVLKDRLFYGSDYPLPAIWFLNTTKHLKKAGLITCEEKDNLDFIYSYNPLLFDFVLKRTIRHPVDKNLKLPDEVFGEIPF